MFADDLKIYREIRSDRDIENLQFDINTINNWCSNNKMVLNCSKCFYLNFSRKRKPTQVSYLINNSPLTEVFSMRDLGVTVDTKLDFREHIDCIAKKCSRLAGFVSRQTKFFKDPDISIIIFNCYVRSILEYCSPVWSPTYKVHIERLEKLQQRFLYHLSYSNNLGSKLDSYGSRLYHFKMSSLQKRRNSADLVFLHKLIHGYIDSPSLLAKIEFDIPRPSSRLINRKTFSLPHSRTNYGHHSCLYRICCSYNNICHDVDIFNPSVSSFKRLLLSI